MRVLVPFIFYIMKRLINFTVGNQPVSLICHDDEHEGPGYIVIVKRSKNVSVIVLSISMMLMNIVLSTPSVIHF